MSILRTYPPKLPKLQFGSVSENNVKFDDSAEDMPIIVERMQRGLTPRTRVATYSSSQFTEDEMLSQPPIKVVDPTDLNFVEYKEKVNEQSVNQQEPQV